MVEYVGSIVSALAFDIMAVGSTLTVIGGFLGRGKDLKCAFWRRMLPTGKCGTRQHFQGWIVRYHLSLTFLSPPPQHLPVALEPKISLQIILSARIS